MRQCRVSTRYINGKSDALFRFKFIVNFFLSTHYRPFDHTRHALNASPSERKTMDAILVTRDDDGLTNMQLYHYQPSMPAAIVFVVLFALATALHFYQMIRTKTWFLVPFVIGGICKSSSYSFLRPSTMLTERLQLRQSVTVLVRHLLRSNQDLRTPLPLTSTRAYSFSSRRLFSQHLYTWNSDELQSWSRETKPSSFVEHGLRKSSSLEMSFLSCCNQAVPAYSQAVIRT